MYFTVFQNCFLLVVFTFLLKNACLEFRSIVVTLFFIVLNIFQTCEHPDNSSALPIVKRNLGLKNSTMAVAIKANNLTVWYREF